MKEKSSLKLAYMHPPQLKGMDFSAAEIENCRKTCSLLVISPMTARVCNLACRACYTSCGSCVDPALSWSNFENVLKEAKDLGARVMRIGGAGEPLMDKNFFDPSAQNPMHSHWPLIDLASSFGLHTIFFTNGTLLDESLVQTLMPKNVTILTKFWGPPSIQEYLTGERGRYRGAEAWVKKDEMFIPLNLHLLIEAGFNKAKPMRLGIECLMHSHNLPYFENIFRWCRRNNIFPYFEMIMGGGRGNHVTRLSREEARETFFRLLAIDQSEFGYSWKPVPPYVGHACDRLFYNLVVNINGDIQACFSTERLGNIHNGDTLEMILKSQALRDMRHMEKHLTGHCGECSRSGMRERLGCKIGGCRCDASQTGGIFSEYRECFY